MTKEKSKTKVKEKHQTLTDSLNQIGSQSENSHLVKTGSENQIVSAEEANLTKLQAEKESDSPQSKTDIEDENNAYCDALFESWDEQEFVPQDFMIDVPIDSLESAVGYSSLIRQMHQAFIRSVAFYRSEAGGSLSIEEARARSFHVCNNKEEAKKRFRELMRLPLESLNFVELMELQNFAPRVAEGLWELAKQEGRKEFESGHLAANISFPVGYMKQVWNIARYLGVRESFIDDWNPKGGIEVALIDMMAQSYFQWQNWLEQTVKRSETRERQEHPEYSRWMAERKQEYKVNGWTDGYWFRPYITEQQAIEQAVQMADRFNRIFMRTLRQLRDLRRYSPVTINNPNQVNIAAEGGKQVNISENS